MSKSFRYGLLPRNRVNDRLNDRGHEVLDPQSALCPVVFRPPTLGDQIARLNRAGQIARGFLPEVEYDEDDFGDDFSDLPDEGLSPYELDAMPTSLNPFKRLSKKKKDEAATTPATPPSSPAEEGLPVGKPLVQ